MQVYPLLWGFTRESNLGYVLYWHLPHLPKLFLFMLSSFFSREPRSHDGQLSENVGLNLHSHSETVMP